MKGNKKGSALTYVIIGSAVLAIIVGLAFVLANLQVRLVAKEHDQKQAYIYAKSGVEYAKSKIASEIKTGSLTTGTYYIYGKVGNITVTKTAPSSPAEIKVTCSVLLADTGDRYDYDINSQGSVLNADNDQAQKTLQYTGSIPRSSSSVGAPIIPKVDNKTVFSGIDIGWIDSGGGVQTNAAINNGSVVLTPTQAYNSSYGKCVNRTNDSSSSFTARQIFFTTSPVSFYLGNKRSYSIKADFIYFGGSIIGGKEASMTLYTNASTLTGKKIGAGDPNATYNVVYFAPGASIVANGKTIFPTADKKAGYYYYPNGINLLDPTKIPLLMENAYYGDVQKLQGDLGIDIGMLTGSVLEGLYE